MDTKHKQPETAILDKDTILTCESKHSVFNSLMQDLGLDEAAKQAGISYDHARRLATKGHIRTLVRQEKGKIEAKIAEKLKITRESLTRNYMTAYDLAEQQQSPTGMTQATMGIARLYGLDKQVIEQSDAQKQLSATQAAEARRIAEIRVREVAGLESPEAEKSHQNGTEEPEYAVDWTDDSKDKGNTSSTDSQGPEQDSQEQDTEQTTEG